MKSHYALLAFLSLSPLLSAQNLLINGDFEDTSGTFPAGWNGSATLETATPLAGANSASAVAINQDFAPTNEDGLTFAQIDLAVRLDSLNQSQRIRIRDNGNALDLITLRFNAAGIDRFSGGWAQALASPLSIETTYFVRITTEDIGSLANRSFQVGLSTDGVNYTTSSDITAFHNGLEGSNFETLTLESSTGGATWDSISVTDNTPEFNPDLVLDDASPDPDFNFPASETGAGVSRTLRFVNLGPTLPITLDSVSLTDDGGGTFAITSVAPATGTSLAVSDTVDITVTATSASSGAFAGLLSIDASVDDQDRDLPLFAQFYQDGETLNSNPQFTVGGNSWGGGSAFTTPDLTPGNGGMIRVQGEGDPEGGPSSLFQAGGVPNGLADWELDFFFSPTAAGDFTLYTGEDADGSFTDRTFQMVIQGDDTAPNPSLDDTLATTTLINLAYFPDGIETGGTPGFYLFDGTDWQLVDFNGDGSGLSLAGSSDADNDGALDAAAGDTVNAYRMSIQGTSFGTPAATYSLTLSGPDAGLPKTVTGLTLSHGLAITNGTPAAFAFLSNDLATDSNAGEGFCTPFWVDAVSYYGGSRPSSRLVVFPPESTITALNGVPAATTGTLWNDGTSAGVTLSGGFPNSQGLSLSSPSLPLTLSAGQSSDFEVVFNPAEIAPLDLESETLALTTTDPLNPQIDLAFTAFAVSDSNLAANGGFESGTTLGFEGDSFTIDSTTPIAGLHSAVSTGVGDFSQEFAGLSLVEATVTFDFRIEEVGTNDRSLHFRLNPNNAIDLVTVRVNTAGELAVFDGVGSPATNGWQPIGTGILPGTDYQLTLTLNNLGLPTANFDIALTGGAVAISETGLTNWHAASGATNGLGEIEFRRTATDRGTYTIDDLVVTGSETNTIPSTLTITDFAVNRTNGQVNLTFTSTEGSSYRIEASNDLGQGDPFAEVSTATGEAGTTSLDFVDSAATTAGTRFYRVVEL